MDLQYTEDELKQLHATLYEVLGRDCAGMRTAAH